MNLRITIAGTLISAITVGCASTPKRNEGVYTKNPNAPEWVARGSINQEAKIYGVGSARGIRNVALARSTAESRARAEVSKILEVYSASLMKDYQASTNAGGTASSEEQNVERAIKTFAANLLKGTNITDVWFDSTQDTYFALAELSIEDMKKFSSLSADSISEAELEQMSTALAKTKRTSFDSPSITPERIVTSEDLAAVPERTSEPSQISDHCTTNISGNHGFATTDIWDAQVCIRRQIPNPGRGPVAQL